MVSTLGAIYSVLSAAWQGTRAKGPGSAPNTVLPEAIAAVDLRPWEQLKQTVGKLMRKATRP